MPYKQNNQQKNSKIKREFDLKTPKTTYTWKADKAKTKK